MIEFFAAIIDLVKRAAGMFSMESMYVIGIVITIPMVVIFALEIFDRRFVFAWPLIKKVFRRWNTKAVSVMAMTAALSVVLQVLSAVIVLIPGTLTLRIDAMVRHSFGGIFGMPAVWGTMLANIIGDALSGTLGPGSIAGLTVSWFQAYFFYRLMSSRQAAMESASSITRYYVVSLFMCIVCSFFLCANFQMLGLIPPEIIWSVVFPAFIVSTFLGGLLGPVLARVIAPIARRYGLSRDEMNYERPLAPASALAVVERGLENDNRDSPGVASSDGNRPAVEVAGVEYAYRGWEDQPVLKGVDMTIEPGSFVIISGRTGSGKSTLCLALTGLIPHSLGGTLTGSVSVGGLRTTETEMPVLGRKVGIVQQSPESQIIGLTVCEDVEFGLENLALPIAEINATASSSLAEVGLQDFADLSPWSLSGGQKQRLAIASALALQPDVLVLDNPTAELDPIGRADVLRTIARLNREKGITIVMVTQEIFEALPYADRLLVIEGGCLAIDAEPGQALQEPQRLRDLGLKLPDIIELADALSGRDAWNAPMPMTIDDAEREIRSCGVTPGASVSPGDTASQSVSGESLISFEGVRFAYGPGKDILRGIDLTISAGEFVAIMGANGAGKTTLGKHLNGLLRPTAGRVDINGKNTLENSVSDMADSVGYVFQNPDHQIVSRHLADELSLGPRNLGWSQDRIDTAVERVMSLFDFTDRDADPFFMGLAGRNLVALASALMMEPRILVLDEPATGADHGMVKRLMKRVAALHEEGLTVVMITHDATIVADYAERLVVVSDGKVVLDGTPTEVFRSGEVLESCQIIPPPILQLTNRLRDLGVSPHCRIADAVEELSTENDDG